MKKIIFCDIDGTLIDNLRGMPMISERSNYAMRELLKNNSLILSSGRSKCIMPDFVSDIKPSGYISANGAYAEFDGKIIFEKYFTFDELNAMAYYCNKRSINYYFETQNEIFTNGIGNDIHIKFNESWHLKDVYISKPYSNDDKINIAMIACNDEESCKEFYDTFKNRFDIRHHHGYTSMDVNLYDNNKGYACRKILEYLNVDKNDAYCFGDGLNDIEMIKSVKYGIAMANANQKLKELAYDVTDDVLDDGFYNGLVKYGLIDKL